MKELASSWPLACLFFAFCRDDKGCVKRGFYRKQGGVPTLREADKARLGRVMDSSPWGFVEVSHVFPAAVRNRYKCYFSVGKTMRRHER